MKIVLSRIDNRLLHGITATQWAPKTKAQRVMIIDDVVANNEMMKSTMKLARPAGMAISIIPLETALDNFKANKYDGQSIFIIVKRVETLKRLIDEANVPIKEINIGATAQIENEDEVLRVNRFTTIDEEEKKIYLELMDKGVDIYAKYLVADPKQDLKDLLK
ncbi:PTS system mannose/fructose/N-acetylgalactosamine-transporter subunit IIB [Amedibacterium intestinale]|jgi:PTS system sorbose subfamily IIB component|uniref:PTS sorbose transporter subunit IIB n=1 Tax=Amedibacterium intestinale TaxID=2583452 RepID=A0A6N4TED6_9FIRM|nr:PTS sugar transporter subunit IIB [Amedibacterium intestinale]RHO24050.1 PTS mannose/fructose/sorbose transporter subunit IIB [Eubacterium sp. AM18-26]RHO28092.1 PTS mannose/fructose/sorbose transporter subunit IIB [Eubacterium sp. AM18-10LB-B]BBK21103.1 PTS sorbose transporter subunit IIB [Amedibacterium intestinale]